MRFKTKIDGKVMTNDGVEYLQVKNIKTEIQVGDSSVKIADKDDSRGLLSEYPCLTFRHRASCILGQAFHYSPENAFLYI